MVDSIKKALTAIFIVGGIHFLLKLKSTRQVILPNILIIVHLVLVGYLFYVLFVLFKSRERTIQILLTFALLLFPIGFLFDLISNIDERILVVYPVAIIAILYLFGEYLGFKKKAGD